MTHTFILHTKDGVKLPESAVDTITFMLETFGFMASPSKAVVSTLVNQPSTYDVSWLPDNNICVTRPWAKLPRVDCGVGDA